MTAGADGTTGSTAALGLPPEAVRQPLAAAAQGPVEETRVFLLASRRDDDWPIERLKMTDALAAQFVEVVKRVAREHAEDQLVGYSAGRVVVDGEAAVMPTASVPYLGDLVATMEGEIAEVGDFSPAGGVAGRLRLYVIAIQLPNSGWVHGIRVKSMASLRPTRSRKVAALWTGELYGELVEDPLVFDDTLDALVVGPQVIVFRQRNFERGLDFLAAAQAEAESVLRSATANLPIANLDDLIAAARTDVNMLAKLRSIAERMHRDPSYARHLTMSNVLAFTAQQPEIELDIEGGPGAEALVFHREPGRRWRILKLLDDDYLHSQLTELNYEVNSKDLL
jgi:hypothetical protein